MVNRNIRRFENKKLHGGAGCDPHTTGPRDGPLETTMSNFTIFHADHGINEVQMKYIQETLEFSMVEEDGFFIKEVHLDGCDHDNGVYTPENTQVPCALYGPAMGDEPVPGYCIEWKKRSEDRPADRMLPFFPHRWVGYVQAIGIKDGDDWKLFTVYGGPLAPRNPEDPTIPTEEEREEARKFWSEHALAEG